LGFPTGRSFTSSTPRHHGASKIIDTFEMYHAAKDVEEGRFHPEREKDELTRALGNDEHPGRTRTTPGSKPWKLGFPIERKKFPDRSRKRRKEREADRMAQIEE
jgi:hypothetical protein